MTEYLVIDVGGSSIKHAIADENFRLTEQGSVAVDFTDHPSFVESVGRIFDPYAGRVSGLAVSICGELDPDSGHMYTGGTHQFNAGHNMLASLRARCPVPVSIENDANSALLAELHDGALADARNAAVLVLGTGVGGAIMINRRLYYGSHFHSGHTSIVLTTLFKPLSAKRMFATTNGVPALAKELGRRTDRHVLDGRSFFAALASGDPDAAAVFEEYCERMALFIYNLNCLLDLDVVAIGGGISAQPILVETIAAKVAAAYEASPIPLPSPEIRVCRHRNDANLIGALQHHLNP